jgi:hypothetical protein
MNYSTGPTLILNGSAMSFKQNGYINGGASISTLGMNDRRVNNFWVTEKDATLTGLNRDTISMTNNEKSFYTTYTRRNAPSHTETIFL